MAGLSTANPSLTSCTIVWGTNTAGTTGGPGNNVNFDRPYALAVDGSTL